MLKTLLRCLALILMLAVFAFLVPSSPPVILETFHEIEDESDAWDEEYPYEEEAEEESAVITRVKREVRA